jgi:two-component system, cell cycle sensor histidine kinase and response regulator CckA
MGPPAGPPLAASEPIACGHLSPLPSYPSDRLEDTRGIAPAAIHWIRQHFQFAAKAAQDLMWDWDLVSGELVWAGTTEIYFQLSPDRVADLKVGRYRMWAERVHPDDLGAAEAAARAAIAGGAESWQHEYRFRRADGSFADILERAFIVRDEGGKALRAVGAMEDVTARKAAERATTRLAAIVSASDDAIVAKTLEGVVTGWNPAAERVFGYSEREMLGQSIFVLIPPELHDSERDILDNIRRGQRVDFADTVRIRKDGTRINIALTVSPVWDSSGVVVGASSIKRDITERKRAEAELARREERYRALVAATTSVEWLATPEGHFMGEQRSWREYTGQTAGEQAGLGWTDAIHPDDRQNLRTGWREARERRTIWETRARLWSEQHHGYRHVVLRAVPNIAPDGSLLEWIGVISDIEDRWLAEERLRHADRMESVGRLAGGIAHEANNQMTVILGSAEFLGRSLESEGARGDLELIRRAARRTAVITQQLLAFSRRQMLQPQVLDLNAVVSALEPILQRALGEISQVKLRLADDLHAICADPGQLDQVLLNLALNARDAMPGGGTLTVETVNTSVDERHATAKAVEPVVPGQYVALVVTDTGTGMDRDTMEHVFEPFFTTKPVGEGTGLGLATVYGIVKQSGGFVSVFSEPGHGSSFRIYLPVAGAGRESEGGPVPGLSGGGHETVLVAEDEPAVRAILARALREYGYTVLEARDGTHALELAQRAPVPPDIVIADVVMPGMAGKPLAEEVERRWPGTPVLFMSGYIGADAVDRGLMEEGRDFLQKPIEPDVLARHIRRILDVRRAEIGR